MNFRSFHDKVGVEWSRLRTLIFNLEQFNVRQQSMPLHRGFICSSRIRKQYIHVHMLLIQGTKFH